MIMWLDDLQQVRSKLLIDYHRPHIRNRVPIDPIWIGVAWALAIEAVAAALVLLAIGVLR